MRIAVVHNDAREGVICRFGRPCPERYGRMSVKRVAEALAAGGHTVEIVEGDRSLLEALAAFMPPDGEGRPTGLVFNMAYGIQGDCRYTHVPSMLEMAGIPYTGSGPLGHALCLDKVVTKVLIEKAGIPTPAWAVAERPTHDVGLPFPLVVKPRHESTSYGLRVVHDGQALLEATEAILDTYRQPALVERYIDGREVNVSLLGNEPPETFSLVEFDFGTRALRIETWDDKFHRTADEPTKRCPAELPDGLAAELCRLALGTFRATHCRDYARVDLRIDPRGRPYVLEINSMASLGQGGSYVLAATTAGLTFDALVNRIVDVAHERYAATTAARAPRDAGATEYVPAAA